MTFQPRRTAPQQFDSDSVFPPSEPSSLGSRPTPIVPASEELRALGKRSHPPGGVHGHPPALVVDSEPPEVIVHSEPPSEGEGPRPSSRPTASFGPAARPESAAPSAPGEQQFWQAAPQPNVLSLPPEVLPQRPRSRARAIFSKVLFVMLFGGIATLLGYAVKKKIDAGSLRPAGSLFAISDAR